MAGWRESIERNKNVPRSASGRSSAIGPVALGLGSESEAEGELGGGGGLGDGKCLETLLSAWACAT